VVSADPAHLRNLTVSRDFIHEETYQRLHYSLQSIVIATYVAEQRAYMAYVDNQLYRITLNGDVSLLQNKPVYDMGRSGTKIDDTDHACATSRRSPCRSHRRQQGDRRDSTQGLQARRQVPNRDLPHRQQPGRILRPAVQSVDGNALTGICT